MLQDKQAEEEETEERETLGLATWAKEKG